MIKALKAYLSSAFTEPADNRADRSLELACTMMMFEVLRADLHTHAREIAKITEHVCNAFGITEHEAELLMQEAQHETEHAVSLHEVIRAVNQEYDAQEKRDLVKMLWDVAYADGQLDPYEEHTIRKLAERLHVPHREFIMTKHEASGEG